MSVNKILVSSILFFLCPLITYLNPYNFSYLSSIDLILLIGASTFIVLFSFFLSIVIVFVFKLKVSFEKIFFLIGFLYFNQFFYEDIKILFSYFNFNNLFLTAFLTIIGIFTFFCFLYLKYPKFQIFSQKFFLVYLLINLVFFSSYNLINYDYENILGINQQDEKRAFKLEDTDIYSKNNIYYIIFDAMISLKNSNDLLNIKNKQFEKKVKQFNYQIFDNFTSNYDRTFLSLNSFFDQKYTIIDGNRLPQNINEFFPNVSEKNKDKIPSLVQQLISRNFKINWFGNIEQQCPKIFYINCFTKDKAVESYFNFFYEIKNVTKFFETTIIGDILKKYVNKSYEEKLIGSKDIFNFLEKNNLSTNLNFNFIHFHPPHPPNNYPIKCNNLLNNWMFGYDKVKMFDYEELVDYKNGYICSKKYILKLISLIKEKDPNANVFIQSDHGWKFKALSKDISRLKVFQKSIISLIKIEKKCHDELKTISTNLNTSILISKCLLNIKKKYKKNKFYYLYPEINGVFYEG